MTLGLAKRKVDVNRRVLHEEGVVHCRREEKGFRGGEFPGSLSDMTQHRQATEVVYLSNGIPVILQNYEGAVAATYWWNRTGSADETLPEAGFAHFLEHMLFKDAAAKETGRASTGQTALAIESLGGDINAYTSFDQTVYHVTCAAQHWEKVIDGFGVMAKPQKFLKSDFEREREVILEELKKNEDSPGRQLFQSLFTETFKKHPYGRPVIGFTKTLKAAKVTSLEGFYSRNYVPGRMGLIVVGPLDDSKGARRKQVLKLLEKRFGASVIKKRPPGARAQRPIEPQVRSADPRFPVRGFDVQSPSMSFSFRVPDLQHPDTPALDLLSGILGSGELGRVYQRLFYQTSLVTEASGGMYIPRDPGMIYFQAELDSVDKLEPAAKELFAELRRIREEGPTKEELERVVTHAESERLYASQTADGLAGRLGFLHFMVDDPEFDRRYLEELRQVDADKIRDVASRYLVPQRLGGAILVPKAAKDYSPEAIARAASDTLSSTSPVIGASARTIKKHTDEGMPDVLKLPSGATVVFRERASSHVMSFHAAALGGLRLELADPVTTAEKDWGVSNLMAQTWTKGTRHLDAQAIASATEGRAASIDGFAGRNTIGLQLTGLARDWGALSKLFTEVLFHPSFPESEMEHSRRVVEDSIKSIEDHSAQLCSKLFVETLFETHPYGKISYGSLESVRGIDGARALAFHKRWIRPERLVISVCGAVKRASLDQWVEEFSAAAAGSVDPQTKRHGDHKPHVEPELKGPRWAEKILGREQVHIIVGGLGTTIFDEDRYAIRLLQNILGGQSGRLFIELREKKSLAYTVSPMSLEGMERGYVGTYIACSPQKKEEAITGIRSVLEKLAKTGPSASEMRRAQEYFLGRRAMDLQGDASLAAHYSLEQVYGLPLQTDAEITKRIQKISPKDIQHVLKRYFLEPHQVTCTVG